MVKKITLALGAVIIISIFIGAGYVLSNSEKVSQYSSVAEAEEESVEASLSSQESYSTENGMKAAYYYARRAQEQKPA